MASRPQILSLQHCVRTLGRCGSSRSSAATPRNQKFPAAFTLIELLVVIAIIGLLTAIGLPAMRGMSRSHAMIAGNRQFLDDLALARQTAIAQHTTVYMVFVPTNIGSVNLPMASPSVVKQITNLYTGRYTTYALLTLRQVGDQPGRTTPKYVTGWRALPSGVFISPVKFANTANSGFLPFYTTLNGPGEPAVPFPVSTNFPTGLQLPCITFDYLGRLVYPGQDSSGGAQPVLAPDQYIPMGHGSIFYNPMAPAAAPDLLETPPGNSTNNIVYINALTGRAKMIQPSF